MYLLLLLIGLIGLVAMTLLGFSHSSAHAPHSLAGHGPAGGHAQLNVHGHGGGHAHALPGHHGAAPSGHTANALKSTLPAARTGGPSALRSIASMLLLSPLDLFSLCFGAGIAGLGLQSLVSAHILPWAAVLGALVFFLGIERPFLSFAMKFVSKPSEGLEGALAQSAIALTNFDNSGRGLIRVLVDDQEVQVLATVDPAELHHGAHINKGDEVVVTSIDAARNTCQVTKEL